MQTRRATPWATMWCVHKDETVEKTSRVRVFCPHFRRTIRITRGIIFCTRGSSQNHSCTCQASSLHCLFGALSWTNVEFSLARTFTWKVSGFIPPSLFGWSLPHVELSFPPECEFQWFLTWTAYCHCHTWRSDLREMRTTIVPVLCTVTGTRGVPTLHQTFTNKTSHVSSSCILACSGHYPCHTWTSHLHLN